MERKIKNAIEEYQCPGCTNGSNTSSCALWAANDDFQNDDNKACKAHSPGTFTSVGPVFLGLPKGFNRLGPIASKYLPIEIYE